MINAAVIGLGRWGQNLVRHVQGVSDEIRFVAGVVRDPSKTQAFADEHGFPLHDSLDAVLRDSSVDALVLATPHSVHGAQIVAAATAGKHVFTEKPFTLTSAEATAAVDACVAAGVTLAVGYNWRFQPALQEMQRMLADGRLGTLLHMEGNFCGPSVFWYPEEHWRQAADEGPAGGMTGRGVHVLDAMIALAGHADRVYARSSRRALDFGLDDTTSMIIDFASGASGYVSSVIATGETWRLQVFGTRGWVEVGDVDHLRTWDLRVCLLNQDDLREKVQPETVTFEPVSTERLELEHFARAATEGRPIATPGGDEVHGVALMEAIVRSTERRAVEAVD